MKIKPIPLDTNYIKSYPNFLSVSIHVLSPALYSTLSPRNSDATNNPADTKFRTSIADIIGFSATYRFVSLGFAFLLKQGLRKHKGYTPSSYHTATIKYNNSSYTLQFRYLKVKGLTDVNTAQNQSLSKRPDIVNKEYQFEAIYNFGWKRYSYLAPLVFSQHQVKSRAGFLIKGGVYYKQFRGDSSLTRKIYQPYYETFGDTKRMQIFTLKIAPGVGGNLVLFKHFCFSMAIFPSLDVFFYRYVSMTNEATNRMESVAFAIDGYVSLGYQSRRYYAGLKYETDRRNAALQDINMSILNSYTGLEFGYRFNAPKVMKKFYKKTMPPGM